MSHADYHFIPEEKISRPYSCRQLIPAAHREWATTADFQAEARNHCCATMFTNLALLLGTRSPRFHAQEAHHVFRIAHHFCPNGPIFTIRRRAPRVFHALSLPCRLETITNPGRADDSDADRAGRKYKRIRSYLKRGCPVALLVAASPFDWHWILAVGYVQYSDGTYGLRIVDEWHRKGLRIYVPDVSCRLISAAAIMPDSRPASVNGG